MRDAKGDVLYVGKASRLRNRLRQYFAGSSNLPPKIQSLVANVVDFDFIVTESEQEALLLESNLIKHHRPVYNARLKDDKSYPFIKIDTTEDFPQVYITRRVARDGAKYFGPFASAGSVRRTLALLKKLFPYRSCTIVITGKEPRPCLDYYIKRCAGPCIGAVNTEQYGEIIDQVVMFLEGKTDSIVKSLSRRMSQAAETLEFERAAALRDQIQSIEKVHEGQKVLNLSGENMDVVAMASGENEARVEVFFVRQGKLIGRDNFTMTGTQDDDPGTVIAAFVEQFYDVNPYIPPKVLLQHTIDDETLVREWLEKKRVGKVELLVPQRGEKKRLVEMVAENAREGLDQMKVRKAQDNTIADQAMAEIQEALGLPALPSRIECYDISNIQGTNTVGSMVVFEEGKPKTAHYRRFKIKTVQGVDDYSSMREMLTRRFKRLSTQSPAESGETLLSAPSSVEKLREAPVLDEQRRTTHVEAEDAEPVPPRQDAAWELAPDLVIIDGGKGHLGAALQVFLELGITNIPLSSLAKENEEIFLPYTPEPIILPRDSQGLFLVQRIRDEAHRFAITFHRERRSKTNLRSVIDDIPGIGPRRRRMLLRKFGSVRGIKDAAIDDIAAVPGMTRKLAEKVKEAL